jgi:uncharacterized protein YfiM (DUF2279 family)
MNRFRICLIFFLFMLVKIASGSDSLKCSRNHQSVFYGVSGVLYAGSMTTLYQAWYRPYSFGKFRFFNDAAEWRGMDKLGHISASWWASQWVFEWSQVAGIPEKNRLKLALGLPMLFMTTVEVFDGFSKGYGFSPVDILANCAGSGLFFFQQKFVGKQSALLRVSFHNNWLYQLRPDLLGAGWPETWLKNYNAQTYWISFPISAFGGVLQKSPAWLCVSAGYGAGGMLGARANIWQDGNLEFDYTHLRRYSRYFLSFDIDLSKLKIRGKTWRMFTSTFRWLKIPMPAVEYSGIRGWRFHTLYW